MLIDIHRHTSYYEADIILRNVFHDEPLSPEEKGYHSVGLHPWHIHQGSIDKDMGKVRQKANYKNVIAIGETGLDKTRDTSTETQESIFEAHIEIAKHLHKPIIIHCVRSYNELIQMRIKSKHKQPWMVHWFNASTEMANDLIRHNCYLSFGISLFNESNKAYRAFKKIPLERIFLETDDADISIKDVYAKASELRGIPQIKLEKTIEQNFKTCFGVKI